MALYWCMFVSVSVIALLLEVSLGVQEQCRSTYYSMTPLELQASPSMPDSIYSPGYPDHYYDDARCTWRIRTYDQGYVIRLRVRDIELEDSFNGDCPYDYIEVFDGRTNYQLQDRLIKKFCRKDVYELYSSGQYMFIEFSSDSTITGKGFHLTYEAVHSSQVPSTTTYRTTTTASYYNDEWRTHINTGALIGGLVGGLLVLFIFCALCRYYMRSNQTSRMARNNYLNAPTMTTTTTTSSHFTNPHTIYQNNNTVFMVTPPANSSTQAVYHPGVLAGATNLAYSTVGDAPPSYFSVQHSSSTSIVQPGVVSTSLPPPSVPPPTYTEAMMLSHPPATPVQE